MHSLTRKQLLAIGTLVLVAFAFGALVGWHQSQNEASARYQQFTDIGRAFRALDLNNRIEMLRLLRQQGLPAQTVKAIETSALLLLDSLEVDKVSPSNHSFPAMRDLSKTIRAYVHDYPGSEFDPTRQRPVADLLARIPEN